MVPTVLFGGYTHHEDVNLQMVHPTPTNGFPCSVASAHPRLHPTRRHGGLSLYFHISVFESRLHYTVNVLLVRRFGQPGYDAPLLVERVL